MARCHIALGGNVGDVRGAFRTALASLDGKELRVLEVSPLYATPPMGAAAGGTYLNAAATLETSLAPLQVLERLLAAEDAAGRVRATRWGPRVIDLDLVFHGDQVIDTKRLRLPHPGCWHRRFVLDPLAEIAPETAHPETGETVIQLRKRLLARPLGVAIEGLGAEELFESLREEFPIVRPDGEAPALTIRIGTSASSAIGRTVGVPAGAAGLEAARALQTAATGAPEAVGELN